MQLDFQFSPFFFCFAEKGIFLVAKRNEKRWTVSSNLKRFDHLYQLIFEMSAGKVSRTAELSRSVANWFDEEGALVVEKFEKDVIQLHNSVSASKKSK